MTIRRIGLESRTEFVDGGSGAGSLWTSGSASRCKTIEIICIGHEKTFELSYSNTHFDEQLGELGIMITIR